MIYVALVEGIALVVVCISFTGLVRSGIRQQAREREVLLDRIMHLSGRTWQQPPSDGYTIPEPEDFSYLVTSPEQLPDE